MKTVSVREAREQLAGLLEDAHAGERILITRYGQPFAQLGPPPAIAPPAGREAAQKRQRGIDDILHGNNRGRGS